MKYLWIYCNTIIKFFITYWTCFFYIFPFTNTRFMKNMITIIFTTYYNYNKKKIYNNYKNIIIKNSNQRLDNIGNNLKDKEITIFAGTN